MDSVYGFGLGVSGSSGSRARGLIHGSEHLPVLLFFIKGSIKYNTIE